MTRTEELLALAEAATPGPWKAAPHGRRTGEAEMKPIGWLLGTSIYDVRQCDDAGFGAFCPDQTAINPEHAKETILSAIRQAKVEVLREAANRAYNEEDVAMINGMADELEGT